MLALSLPIVAAYLMHSRDHKWEAGGIGHLYRYYDKPWVELSVEVSAIRGIMSRESVQLAVTLGVLAVVIDKAERVPEMTQLLTEPERLIEALIVCVLAFSIIVTLASLISYDYSMRFEWGTEIRKVFVTKGHDLGRIGFYTQMWSLAAITALLKYELAMGVIVVAYFFMWYFYFLPVCRIKKLMPQVNPRDGVSDQ